MAISSFLEQLIENRPLKKHKTVLNLIQLILSSILRKIIHFLPHFQQKRKLLYISTIPLPNTKRMSKEKIRFSAVYVKPKAGVSCLKLLSTEYKYLLTIYLQNQVWQHRNWRYNQITVLFKRKTNWLNQSYFQLNILSKKRLPLKRFRIQIFLLIFWREYQFFKNKIVHQVQVKDYIKRKLAQTSLAFNSQQTFFLICSKLFQLQINTQTSSIDPQTI